MADEEVVSKYDRRPTMRAREFIQPTPLQIQQKQLDSQQKVLTRQKKSLKVKKAQDDLTQALKNEATDQKV